MVGTTAGVFFAIRELLERDGADVSRLTPSSLISEFSIEHFRVFEQDVSQLAPGVLPSIKILNPDYERATGFQMLAIFGFFCSLLVAIWIPYLWIPFGIFVFLSILWLNHVALHSKPTTVSFGELKTFRDICRTLAPQVRTYLRTTDQRNLFHFRVQNPSPMNEENPYEPTSSEPAKPLNRIRWLHRFAILNCVIFSIPILGAFAAYLVSEANGNHPALRQVQSLSSF